jgi:hypothetical protein
MVANVEMMQNILQGNEDNTEAAEEESDAIVMCQETLAKHEDAISSSKTLSKWTEDNEVPIH